MRVCPRCGTQNLDDAAACTACGTALAPAAPARGLKQTMIGMAPRGVPVGEPAAGPGGQLAPPPVIAPPPAISAPGAAPPAANPKAPARAGTMIGMPSPFGESAEVPSLQGSQSPLGQTLPSTTPSQAAPLPPHFGPSPELAPGPEDVRAPPGQTEAGTWVPTGVTPREAAPGAGLNRTMVGFGGPSAPRMDGQRPQTPPPQGGFGSTMLHAPPDPARGAAPQYAPPTPHAPPANPLPAQQQLNRTMLGVARPGIAPLHPGRGADAAPAPYHPPPPPFIDPAPAPQAPSPFATQIARPPELTIRQPSQAAVAPQPGASPFAPPAAVPPKKPAGIPKGAIILLAVAGALAITAGVVAFLWESPRPISADVELDDRGAEQLMLTCDDCTDGTQVSLGGNQGTFKAKKAALALPKPLDVGKNELTVAVHRPGLGRDEEVKLAVGVDYRVRGDLTALSEDPPKVKVLIQAVPGATAVVDGKPVALDASGKGEFAADVARELEGPADAILPFERKLPYSIALPGAEPHAGDVTLRFGIVPLRIVAPGNGIVIEGETFMLSGRTLKDGRVTVSGRPITVDSEGRFAQLMNVSAVGETTVVVRSEAKDHAPRLVRVHVRRVASLKDLAASLRQTSLTDYPSVVAGPKVGSRVALDGEVFESRIDGDVTVLLLDVKKGCSTAPCLTRVVHGARFDAKKGAALGAFGQFTGLVDGPRTGVKIPEVAADFLLIPPKTR